VRPLKFPQAAPAGVYKLDDDTHAYWLNLLAQRNFSTTTAPMSDDLLAYYSNLNAPLHTKKHPKDWKRLMSELDTLKHIPSPSYPAAPSLTP
jgi:hypothetical protein